MTYLPARPDLAQLRHQAKDLLREATAGETGALARIHAVSDRVILASAQLAIAREYGFESWPKLKREVERRDVLNSRNVDRLASLLAEDPEPALSHTASRAPPPSEISPTGSLPKRRCKPGSARSLSPRTINGSR